MVTTGTIGAAFGRVLRRVRAEVDSTAVRLQAGSRSAKWDFYERSFPPRRGERILDLGVSSLDDVAGENYFLRRYPFLDQLTAVGVDDLGRLEERYPEVTFVRADGRMLPFPDDSFDVVHSNAVIEHVGGRAEQERFVAELVRVGRAGFVTTPNRWFPIETHSKVPLLHWLPRPIVHRLAKRFDMPDLRWWLLGARTFQRMFPASTTLSLHRTRLFGWPLTIVVVFRRNVSSGS